jgi:coatomer subunit beta
VVIRDGVVQLTRMARNDASLTGEWSPRPQGFLDHIVASTNMKCLTPLSALEGDCGFLAANLYAKSVFGEDALVNVSVEKQPSDGKLSGYIRIRSKTQGIALSLGDKITLKQKGPG